MEQTNLVVTPDGQTWDEVTRDTSYIGNICVTTTTDTDFDRHSGDPGFNVIFDEWRGDTTNSTLRVNQNKNWAIAYDTMICLVDGMYTLHSTCYPDDVSAEVAFKVNGVRVVNAYSILLTGQLTLFLNHYFKRGDKLIVEGEWGIDGSRYHLFQISKG